METLGIDQYGTTYRNLGEHPRKALAQRLGFSPKSARKVYQDKKDGRTVHTGYAFGHYWISLYTLTPVERFCDRHNAQPQAPRSSNQGRVEA